MRAGTFLNYLAEYNRWNEVEMLASQPMFKGGWEVWLQVELAKFLKWKFAGRNIIIEREHKYPTGNTKCDFYIGYGEREIDETYIELKCQNPMHENSLDDLMRLFWEDIDKAEKSRRLVTCMAVCYGTVAEIIQKADLVKATAKAQDRISFHYRFWSQRTGLVRDIPLPTNPNRYLAVVCCEVAGPGLP